MTPDRAPRKLVSSLAEWRDTVRASGFAVFFVVSIALVGAAVLIGSTLAAERVQRQQADHTARVLDALSTVLSATTDGETGQRGYFITSDERYLDSYNAGRQRYAAALAALEEETAGDPSPDTAALIEEIGRMGDHKWAEMSGTIEQVRARDIAGAHVRILSDEGKLAMDRLRAAVTKLQRIESDRLATSTQNAGQAERMLLPAIAFLFVVIVVALMHGLWQVTRTARAEIAAANAAEIEEARDRADLLARELNHRVKNLFAVVLAIVRMTGRGDPAAKPVVTRIADRIHALVNAHQVTSAGAGGEIARPQVDLARLVEAAIAPYRGDDMPCRLDGPALILPAHDATPLGLVMHELVTNAVKYGAWSAPGGALAIAWHEDGADVRIAWTETLPPGPTLADEPGANGLDPGRREGFGTLLIESSARQLGGTIERRIDPDGVTVRITFPKK